MMSAVSLTAPQKQTSPELLVGPEGDIVFRPLRAATAFAALQDHLSLRAAFQMSNCF
jgi:hypothetical protein